MAAYHLSAQLHGHEDDVCGICICGDVGVATSSRDKTVKFWTQHPEKKCEYVLSKTLVGHSSFVGPMAWAPPSDRFPDGAIVSGGMDTLVLRWNLHTGEVVGTMKGHTSQVTGLAICDNGDIISSSMDCTLRRWRDGNAVEVLENHKVAVQTVLKLPSGEVFTGSSDSTIKLYKGAHRHTFSGHADTVCCLAHMPGMGILSASHDGTIKLWALTGQPLLEMIGHTSLVYSVDAHSSGLIASGSEDRSVKIWKDGICVQTIEHPGCIWDAKFLDNGDVVTACSDGVVRMWTTDNNRFCSDEELAAYTDIISQYTLSRKTVGGLKLMDLPRVEALQVQGHTTTTQPSGSIPEEIIIWEIIPRLPAKAFLRCRTVCRSWNLLLTSNRELLLRHHRCQPSLPIASCMDRSDCNPCHYDLRAFDPQAGTLSPFAGLRFPWLFLRASCDGLLVLSSPPTCFYVCNPSTREWLSLSFFAHFLGFYPHRSSGEYRILYRSSPPPVLGPYDQAFYYNFTEDPEDYKHSYHIYTLGSEERRCISRPAASASVDEALAEGSVNTTSHHPSVLFREDLHFYPVNKQGSNMIMVFNTSAESFHWMSAPAIPKSAKSATLFEMNSKLVLYGINDGVTMVNIWMLQDYDNQVWEFKYKVELPVAELHLSAAHLHYISPVVCEKGDVLLSMHSRLVHVDTLGNLRSDFLYSGRDLSIVPYKLRESLLHHTFFLSDPFVIDILRPLL